MVHLALAPQKDAHPRLLARDVPLLPLGLELGSRGKVVLDRLDRGVQRHVEVIVEGRAVARVPGEGPADLALPGVKLGEGSARDDGESRVARGEVAEIGDMLAWEEKGKSVSRGRWLRGGSAGFERTDKRASVASALGVRAKHEVVDDELVFAVEEVLERQCRSLRTLELVLLVDEDHGELADLRAQSILGPRKLLLLLEERLAGGNPLLSGDNLCLLSVLSCRAVCTRAQHTLGAAMVEVRKVFTCDGWSHCWSVDELRVASCDG